MVSGLHWLLGFTEKRHGDWFCIGKGFVEESKCLFI